MRTHWSRSRYYVIGKGVMEEPDYLTFRLGDNGDKHAKEHEIRQQREPRPVGKYGKLFRKLESDHSKVDRNEMICQLIKLGQSMNQPTAKANSEKEESKLPSGYTYLGQFLAHELTFDKTELPVFGGLEPDNYRSPQLDLDSLYGRGPIDDPNLYQDAARLKIGETMSEHVRRTFLNDLPRAGFGSANPRKALIADPRNDENLALAQMHVAFAKFHNRVVDLLCCSGFNKYCPEHPKGACPPEKLFDCARREVTQHFQAILLSDYLPRILDEAGRARLEKGKLEFYCTKDGEGMFMPLEFSVAAFRFGHSMIRSSYHWNYVHSTDRDGGVVPDLHKLFEFTQFSGNLGQMPRLSSDWIIDWRRFFDFTEMGYPAEKRTRNFARKIDTSFNLHLDKIPHYPHGKFPVELQAITVRNLLRGYSLELPTGEQVAERTKAPWRLTPDEIAVGPHETILREKTFQGRTPLWYYVLREAEVNNQKHFTGALGPVGSCIVAETFLALITESPHSILKQPDWRPQFGRHLKPTANRQYRMIDLLKFADVIDPVGEYLRKK